MGSASHIAPSKQKHTDPLHAASHELIPAIHPQDDHTTPVSIRSSSHDTPTETAALTPLHHGSSTAQYEPNVVLAVAVDEQTIFGANGQTLQKKHALHFSHLGITVMTFEVSAQNDAADIINKLGNKGVTHLALNQYYTLDSALKQQKEPAPPAHTTTTDIWPPTCQSRKVVKIGMVDGMVNTDLPIFRGKHITATTFSSGKNARAAEHGAAIAAQIVGSATDSASGLIPKAQLYAAAAFSDAGNTAPRGTVLAIVKALDWLVGNKVQVINLSFSGPDNDILALAIKTILQHNIPVVAAAGNHGPDGPPAYPGAYPGVIAVTAVDRYLRPYPRANHGHYISFAAPGVRIPVPCKKGKTCYKSGTSFAAPYCTAQLAMLLSGDGKHSVITDNISRLRAIVQDLGAPGKDPIFGWGFLPPCSTL